MRVVPCLLLGLPLAWYPLRLLHECGHVLSAWLGGATGIAMVWHAGFLPETRRDGSQWPLVDVWAGPAAGVLLPLALHLLCCRTRMAGVTRVFAALACLGNGLYVGLGWLDVGGDPEQMLRWGSPLTVLLMFGLVATGLGLRLLLAPTHTAAAVQE